MVKPRPGVRATRRFPWGAASADGKPDGRGLGVADLEAVLIDDVSVLLRRWRRECADRPGAERSRLLLLALEREQIVAVAYREEAVAGRVAELDVGDQARALIRQTLVWIWKDEQLHAEFTRGLLLEAGGLGSSLVVYGRQVQGTLSGWTSSTATNRMVRSAPLRTGAAGVLVAAAKVARRMPPERGNGRKRPHRLKPPRGAAVYVLGSHVRRRVPLVTAGRPDFSSPRR